MMRFGVGEKIKRGERKRRKRKGWKGVRAGGIDVRSRRMRRKMTGEAPVIIALEER